MRDFIRIRQYLSITRIIAGLIVAPFLGLLLYFIALSLQSPFSFDAFGSSVMSSLIYCLSIMSNLGPYFLVLALILGTIVMLLLMKYYSCNIAICVIGAVMNTFLAAILFLILLLLTGAGFMPALSGSVLLLSFIAVPAIPTGILFWFMAVFKNTFLRSHWEMEVN
jgi:hypothetical protein